MTDAELIAWIEQQANKGQIQIARSILGTGYEIAVVPKGSGGEVHVKKGSLRDAISALAQPRPPEMGIAYPVSC